jgi:hypothetical protein
MLAPEYLGASMCAIILVEIRYPVATLCIITVIFAHDTAVVLAQQTARASTMVRSLPHDFL